MRISDLIPKPVLLCILTTVLVGCTGDFGTGSNSAIGINQISKSVVVKAGGTEVIVVAPDRFCVDKATVDENPRGVFMFLSDCQIVENSSGNRLARLPVSAILTASISPTGMAGSENGMKPALTALRGFLESEVGTFTLGKSNVEDATKILSVKQTDNALYLLVQDSAFRDEAGASNRYWRAFSEVNGRLVALSVTGYAHNDSEEKRSLAVIRAFMQAVLDANVSSN